MCEYKILFKLNSFCIVLLKEGQQILKRFSKLSGIRENHSQSGFIKDENLIGWFSENIQKGKF